MNHYTLVALVLMWAVSSSQGRDTLGIDYLKKHTHYILVNGESIGGNGAEWFRNELSQHHFVLMGEYHGDREIGKLTLALLHTLRGLGYDDFVIETGWHSAEYLQNIFPVDTGVLNELTRIIEKYSKEGGDTPIPFFDGVEDARFLKKALADDWDLHGIDQEYLYGNLLWLDEMYRLSQSSVTEEVYQAAREEISEIQKSSLFEKGSLPATDLLNSEKIKAFVTCLDMTNPKIKSWTEDVHLSWQIYAWYGYRMHENLKTRSDLMKARITEVLKTKSDSTGLPPKCFIKMGGYHTMRGLTYNQEYEIGSYIHALSKYHGVRDLNIGFMFRYFEDEEEELGYSDNAVGESQWLTEHRPLIQMGAMEEWAIIDMRQVRKDVVNRDLWVYPAVRKRMFEVDLLVIIPKTNDVTPLVKGE